MDVSTLVGLSTAQSQARTGDAMGIVVLKKAMEVQAQGALQLLQALPQPASNPPHLGQNVDVTA